MCLFQKYCKRKIPEEFRKAFRKDYSSPWNRKIPEGLRKDSPDGFSSRSTFLVFFCCFAVVVYYVSSSPSCSVFVVLLLLFYAFIVFITAV